MVNAFELHDTEVREDIAALCRVAASQASVSRYHDKDVIKCLNSITNALSMRRIPLHRH